MCQIASDNRLQRLHTQASHMTVIWLSVLCGQSEGEGWTVKPGIIWVDTCKNYSTRLCCKSQIWSHFCKNWHLSDFLSMKIDDQNSIVGQTSKLGLAKDYILNTQKSALQILQNSLTYHIASVHIDWN